MKKNRIFILLFTILLNCSSDNNSKLTEKIIFGEIYGQCGGDCRSLFLLTDQGIFEDANTDVDFGDFIELSDWENTTFKNKPLPDEKFELAKTLLSIPDNLFELENTILNQQVVADFDYFIYIKKGNSTQTLVFDRPHKKANNESIQYLENLIKISKELTKGY